MTDFCITAVRYNERGDHITYVQVREEIRDGAGKLVIGNPRTVSRAFVADLIRLSKATFQTRTRNTEGKWASGAEVHTLEDIYLTTQRNSFKRDNLGNLPEF